MWREHHWQHTAGCRHSQRSSQAGRHGRRPSSGDRRLGCQAGSDCGKQRDRWGVRACFDANPVAVSHVRVTPATVNS
jgi:hypothetical protein